MAPADSNPMVLFYVKDMFDKAHVPLSDGGLDGR